MYRTHSHKSEVAEKPVRADLLRRTREGDIDRVPPVVHDVLRSQGQPLEASTRGCEKTVKAGGFLGVSAEF